MEGYGNCCCTKGRNDMRTCSYRKIINVVAVTVTLLCHIIQSLTKVHQEILRFAIYLSLSVYKTLGVNAG